jgi:hypothetical protein
LTHEHGENLHDRGIVEVSVSSVYSGVPQNVLGFQQHWYSEDLPGQWICYHFKDRLIQLTHYSVAAHTNNHFLRSWVVEGSLDGTTWMVLDERRNNAQASKTEPIPTFSVEASSFVRSIRLRLTGKTADNNYYLILSAL